MLPVLIFLGVLLVGVKYAKSKQEEHEEYVRRNTPRKTIIHKKKDKDGNETITGKTEIWDRQY